MTQRVGFTKTGYMKLTRDAEGWYGRTAPEYVAYTDVLRDVLLVVGGLILVGLVIRSLTKEEEPTQDEWRY